MTKRQVKILKTLYHAQDYLTFQELAQQLDVSVKTVRNDIAAIRDFLGECKAGKIQSKPHVGVKLSITQEEWQALTQSDTPVEDREIVFFIIRHLLKEDSLTAQGLAERYYIGRAQLDKILEPVSQWFQKNHILFERRRGKGIHIQYCEFNYRLAMLDFYMEFKEELYQSGSPKESRFTSMNGYEYTAMSTLLDGFDPDTVVECISRIETQYGFHFSYTANIACLFLTALSILRMKRGFLADTPQPPQCKTDGTSDGILCEAFTQELETKLGCKVPEKEQAFLLFAISVSEIQGFHDDQARRFFEYQNAELCRLTVKFVNLASEITNVDLRDDRFFVYQMFLQLKAMIARLKYQTGFKNLLLKQIKAKYPNMMAMAWSISTIFEKELQLDINEHEVGFLALHIGGAIERSMAGLQACIVCDYGVGVSQILKEKIERAIPDIRITAVLSNRDMRRIKQEPCDLIISTMPLEGFRLEREVLVVSHLLETADIRHIEDKMKQIRTEKRNRGNKIQNFTFSDMLFKQELLYPALQVKDKWQALQQMCTKLEGLGYVAEEFEQSVLEREQHMSTEVGKGIAVPHGHSKYVNRSVVAFARLAQPVEWFEGSEEVDLVFLLAFDMDETKGMKHEIVKFYKSLVAFMEDDAAGKRLRGLDNAAAMIQFFKDW